MKKLLVIVPVAALLAAMAALVLHSRSRSPEVLLRQLEQGKGDKEEIIMRLNVSGTDVVGPMIDAFQEEEAGGEFRAEVLELLFRRWYRSPEPRVEKVIMAAVKDADPIVRERAAICLAVYGKQGHQVALVDSLSDSAPRARREAYIVLGAWRREGEARGGLWGLLSDTDRSRMVETCQSQAKTEQDPELRYLARAIIGREVEALAEEALEAIQNADLGKAEEILQSALELDPESRQAQIRLTRFYLKIGEREKALELARHYGAFIEVPELSGVPVIDGDPTDPVWSEAYRADEFYRSTSRWVGVRAEGKSRAYIGHRDGKVYVSVLGFEENLEALVMVHKGRDSAAWLDDCVEIVFDPGSTEKDYYQFVINPAGTLYDRTNNAESDNYPCEYAARIFRDRGYWACEFAVDGKDLDGNAVESGTIWSLCVLRVRIGPASEGTAIWPLYGATHRLDLYPVALFK